MAQQANTWETGIADGTTITTTNSDDNGAGDALSGTQIDTGATFEFDTSTAAHGARCARCATGGSSGQAYGQWFGGTVSGTTLYLRAYVYVAAAPASNTNILRLLVGTGTIVATVRINSTGKMAFLYSSGTLGGTSSANVNTGAWFRVEMKAVASTTAGSVEVRLYNSMDSTTPTETLSVSGVNTGSNSAMDRFRFGIISSVTNTEVLLDDVAWSTVNWLGPSGGTTVEGALAGTLPALTAAEVGTVEVSGQAATALPALTAAVAGQVTVAGGATAVLPALTADLAGGGQVTGALAAALPALAASTTGVVDVGGGQLAAILPTFSAAAAGTLTVTGQAAADLPALTAAAAGTVQVQGQVAAVLPALTASGAAQVTVRGAGAAVLPALTATVAGHVQGEPGDLSVVLVLAVGPPQTKWAAAEPDLKWSGADPVAKWAAGRPAV